MRPSHLLIAALALSVVVYSAPVAEDVLIETSAPADGSTDPRVTPATVVPEISEIPPKTVVSHAAPSTSTPSSEHVKTASKPDVKPAAKPTDASKMSLEEGLYAREQTTFAIKMHERLQQDPEVRAHFIGNADLLDLGREVGLGFNHVLLKAERDGQDKEEVADELEKHVKALQGDDKKSHDYAMQLVADMRSHPVYKAAEQSLFQSGAYQSSELQLMQTGVYARARSKLVFCTSAVIFMICKCALSVAVKAAMMAAKVALKVLPRVLPRLLKRFGPRILKLMPKNLARHARHFGSKAFKAGGRFAKRCKKSKFCKSFKKRMIKELKKEIKSQIKDKFQMVLNDLLGEVCGAPTACQGQIYSDVFSRKTDGGQTSHHLLTWHGNVMQADSTDECALQVYDINQHWKIPGIDGAAWSSPTKHCYATIKTDPYATAVASRKKGNVGWDSCLVRGPCQTIHTGDLISSREEIIQRGVSDITTCAWLVSWQNKGANGATLYNGHCYAEYGADPYEKGIVDHAEHIWAATKSCMLWEGQDDKSQNRRKKRCQGKKRKSCNSGKKNYNNRPYKREELLQTTLPAGEAPYSLPEVPLSVQQQKWYKPGMFGEKVTDTPSVDTGRRLLGGRRNQGNRRRRGDQQAANAICGWEAENQLVNSCMGWDPKYGGPRVINPELGFMYGDLAGSQEVAISAAGEVSSLAECANMVALYADENGAHWNGATWHQPDPALAQGKCWAEIMATGLDPRKHHVPRGGTDARPQTDHQSCIINLNMSFDEEDFKPQRDYGLIAPKQKSCESQGWQSPANEAECKEQCNRLGHNGGYHHWTWHWTTKGCFVTQYADGSLGNCHYNKGGKDHAHSWHSWTGEHHPAVCKVADA